MGSEMCIRDSEYFIKGAHMPLCVFLQENRNAHRSTDGWKHKHETWRGMNEASHGNMHMPPMWAEAQGKGKGKRNSHTVAAPHKGHGGKAGTEEYAHTYSDLVWPSPHQVQPIWQSWMPPWGCTFPCVLCGAGCSSWSFNYFNHWY